jgi:hypothetical protein
LEPTLIINTAKAQDNSLIDELHDLTNQLRLQDYHAILVGGDFNLHHPLWNPVNYTKHDPHVDTLVDFMTERSLQPLLPPGTITFPLENRSREPQ